MKVNFGLFEDLTLNSLVINANFLFPLGDEMMVMN